MKYTTYRKWDIVRVNFPDTGSSTLCGVHPAIILSHDVACANSPCLMVVHGTSNLDGADRYMGQVVVPASKEWGLSEDTRFDCGKVTTIDVSWIQYCTGTLLNTPYLYDVEKALRETLSLPEKAAEDWRPKRLMFVFCPNCGARFVTDANCGNIVCRSCSTSIDRTVPRYKYSVYCDGCGVEWMGETNADPKIPPVTRCKCGKNIQTKFDKKSGSFVAQV